MNEIDEVKKELDPEEMSADILFEDEVASNDGVSDTEKNVTETVIENVPENDAVTKADEMSEIAIDEYKAVLEEHFQKLRSLIKYTKAKDETIQKLSNKLQKYREDYCAKHSNQLLVC